MTITPHSLFEPLRTLVGPAAAKRLAQMSWGSLEAAVREPSHHLRAGLEAHHLDRLRAVVALCRAYYPNQDFHPRRILCSADVVRYYAQRCLELTDRVIWLLCLDAEGCVAADVLVQVGGDPLAPPSVKAILRHALIKEAVSVVVADHRRVALLRADEPTLAVWRSLAELGNLAGVTVLDYLILNRDYALSLAGEPCKAPGVRERAA